MHLSFDIGSGKFQGRGLPVEAYRARVVHLLQASDSAMLVHHPGLEPNPSSYCYSGVGCGYQRLGVGHCEGGVEAACPDLILASVALKQVIKHCISQGPLQNSPILYRPVFPLTHKHVSCLVDLVCR